MTTQYRKCYVFAFYFLLELRRFRNSFDSAEWLNFCTPRYQWPPEVIFNQFWNKRMFLKLQDLFFYLQKPNKTDKFWRFFFYEEISCNTVYKNKNVYRNMDSFWEQYFIHKYIPWKKIFNAEFKMFNNSLLSSASCDAYIFLFSIFLLTK